MIPAAKQSRTSVRRIGRVISALKYIVLLIGAEGDTILGYYACRMCKGHGIHELG